MKILVIGGSYFYGRVFVMLAAEKHDVTVVNRGTYSMEEFGARQIRGERHDAQLWKSCGGDYDAVVDFCAYEPGDIRTVLENLPGSPGQYILISTVDVYRRGDKTAEEHSDGEAARAETGEMKRRETGFEGAETGEAECKEPGCAGVKLRKSRVFKDEMFPLEERCFPGEAGAYIAGKTALEGELRQACGERGIPFTVLRPAILYGPYNYAPRESLFIQMAVRGHVLPRYIDADGRFQFVYVKDAAEAVLCCLGNASCRGQAYNLCGDEVIDYDLFFREMTTCAAEALSDIDRDDREEADGGEQEAAGRGQNPKTAIGMAELNMTLAEAVRKGMPIPFPATAQETELVSNQKSKEELGLEYTPLHQGMMKTFRAFSRVYAQPEG